MLQSRVFQRVRHDLVTEQHQSIHAAAAAKLQQCPTLCNPIDHSPAGSTVPGILQGHGSGLPCPSTMHESEK